MRKLSLQIKGAGGFCPQRTKWPAFFKGGNTYSKTENLTPEANAKRLAGLRKAWAKQRHNRQEKDNYMSKQQRKRERVKLRQTIAREHRDIQEQARTHADQAIKRLAEIINNPNSIDSTAIMAANVLLDRAYGKSLQTNVTASIDANGKPSEITGKELNQRVAEALKRIEALTGGAPKEGKSEKRPADLRVADPDPDSTTKH